MNSGEDESDLQRKTKIKGILIFQRKLNQKIFLADKEKKVGEVGPEDYGIVFFLL